ncbi:MAG: hypothetical protein E6J41_05165 [Chloroflexi bacterium]|nr:MAG: hypothetical protein E6J41_05165 [Chloroflexota bacterium]
MSRPASLSGTEAGRRRTGGWIAPAGTFYSAQYLHHLRVAAELRATGDGPGDPWDMRDGWVMVRCHGEVIALPDRVSQAQLDTLADMLLAAPDTPYRSELMASLRLLLEMACT